MFSVLVRGNKHKLDANKMKWQLRNRGEMHTALQDAAQQHFAQTPCIGCYHFRLGYSRGRISSILFHTCSLFRSLSLSLTSLWAISLCLQPVAIQLCFRHLWKALSCSRIVLNKLARVTLYEGFSLWMHKDKPLVSSPHQHHACVYARTHTHWLMVQFNP